MYRFLMVDDEEIVRRGFATKIDWASQGFEFLPPCENGRDAILAIDALLPDVVITDIHMPFADGITVAAHVMERHPEIVVVILSGYDEFNYAQAAIRNKVFDYILKPVSSRDLTSLLAKIRAKLDADHRSREDETSLKAMADRSTSLLREKNLAELMASPGFARSPESLEELLGFDPSPFACAAIAIELDRLEAGDGSGEELRARLEGSLKQAFRSAFISPAEGRVIALVFDPSMERCQATAIAAALALASSRAKARGEDARPELRVGVGRAYPKWIDAPRSFSEAQAALAYRLVRDASRPFLYAQVDEDRDAIAELRSREERLCLGIRTGAAARVPELARAYLEALEKAQLSPQRLRHEIISLFSRSRDELSGLGVTSAVLSTKLACDYYRLAESLDSSEAVVAALERLVEVAASTLEASSLHEPEWKVLDFKELVARHYADKGFSIGKAAERLSISESYLSKLLRKRLGTSFVDYLADYRVGRAKELLASSDMLAYEISEAVGYPDSRYFASIFKKRAGMTLSEYRASLGAASRSRENGEA
jgi:two-component system, response regulator YesN